VSDGFFVRRKQKTKLADGTGVRGTAVVALGLGHKVSMLGYQYVV
jgi:hypothetical protein